MACVECRELLPLTAEERESFHAYAEANRTEPDGTESQWANHTVRALAELERRVAECRELREALRSAERTIETGTRQLADLWTLFPLLDPMDMTNEENVAWRRLKVLHDDEALLSQKPNADRHPLGSWPGCCSPKPEPAPLIDHEFVECPVGADKCHYWWDDERHDACCQPRAAHRGGKR